ncbi:MAG: addiction module protein [Planctomycetota bacterium]
MLRDYYMAKRVPDLSNLSVEEKLQLIEDLWDSVADDPKALPLTDAQAEELDRRLDAYRQDGDPGRSWREVLDELESLRK